VGSTGNECPASTSGVAKSARELANSSKKALANPGVASGTVTEAKVPSRERPRLREASSRFGSMADSTADNVRKATGKTVRVSDNHVPQNP